MIEKLQRISAQIFKNALKTYTLREVVTHKRVHANNIVEILSLYPNKGVGFTIKRKQWPPGFDYEVKRTRYKSLRNGAIYGQKRVDGIVVQEYPKKLHGCNKRGIWTYDLGTFQQFKNDNGVIYNRADYEAFLKIRHIGVTRPTIRKEEQEEEIAIEGPENSESE